MNAIADVIRLLALAGYIIGTVLINRRLRTMTFELSGRYPEPEERGLLVIQRVSTVLLWPVLWLLWIGWWDGEVGFIPLVIFMAALTLLSWLPWLRWTGLLGTAETVLYALVGLMPVLGIAVLKLMLGASFLALLLPALFAVLPPLGAQLVLLTMGPDLLPFRPEQVRRHRRDIMAWYMGLVLGFFRPTWVVENGEAVMRLNGNQFNGSGPSLVVPEPHTAVVTTTGSMITGVQGPEPFFISGEAPFAVLDLREQIRGERVRARTSNGIELEVPISTIFRIHGSENVRLGEPWPYRRGAAYTALFAAEVDPTTTSPIEGRRARSWDSLPLDLAKAHVRRRIANYHLDDIFPVRPDVDLDKITLPRLAISGEVRREVSDTLERVVPELTSEMLQSLGDEMAAKGVAIVGGSIGNRIVPVDKSVVQQRIEAWRARWMRRAMLRQAEAEAERYRLMEKARQRVLQDVLQKLASEHERLRALGPQKSAALLAVRLLDTLDQIANEAEMEAYTPEASRNAIRLIRQRMVAQTEILERSTGGTA